MKKESLKIVLGICLVLVLTIAFSGESMAKTRVIFGGGPAGGTFQVVANGIQVYKPVKEVEDFSVKAQTSAGSVENLRKTDAGRQQMSVVYSGHVWLGRNGKMKNDPKKYENVMAVAWLYGAPAQLVVRADQRFSYRRSGTVAADGLARIRLAWAGEYRIEQAGLTVAAARVPPAAVRQGLAVQVEAPGEETGGSPTGP